MGSDRLALWEVVGSDPDCTAPLTLHTVTTVPNVPSGPWRRVSPRLHHILQSPALSSQPRAPFPPACELQAPQGRAISAGVTAL